MDIEDYVNANQAAGEPGQPEEPPRKVAEMAITSNLTTLNLDGDNTSGEGEALQAAAGREAAVPGAALDEEELQQLKDKKYLDQFRRRQNRLNSKAADQPLELNQIEIEIQENSDPGSPDQPPAEVAIEPQSAGRES